MTFVPKEIRTSNCWPQTSKTDQFSDGVSATWDSLASPGDSGIPLADLGFDARFPNKTTITLYYHARLLGLNKLTKHRL